MQKVQYPIVGIYLQPTQTCTPATICLGNSVCQSGRCQCLPNTVLSRTGTFCQPLSVIVQRLASNIEFEFLNYFSPKHAPGGLARLWVHGRRTGPTTVHGRRAMHTGRMHLRWVSFDLWSLIQIDLWSLILKYSYSVKKILGLVLLTRSLLFYIWAGFWI